jgi:hypothetical protein
VFWNTHGLSYMQGKNMVVNSHQFGWGYVIGTRGPASAVSVAPTLRTFSWANLPNVETAPQDFVEGTTRGAFLEPTSLYEDQLLRRLAQ